MFKRKIGFRPDYEWKYKPEDKINANNASMCSFAYIIDNNKKVMMNLFSWLSLLIELRVSRLMIIVFSSILIDWLLMIIKEQEKGIRE